jgi:hypothetical protein
VAIDYILNILCIFYYNTKFVWKPYQTTALLYLIHNIKHMFALNIIFDILKDSTIFHKGCVIEITCHGNINTNKKQFWLCFMNLSLLFITLNIIAPTSDISSITTSCNCSYGHVKIFNESNDKFDKLNKYY